MNVAHPVLLYALFALPLFALMLFVQYRRVFPLIRKASLQKGAFIKSRYFYSGLFRLLAFAALITAAAGPSLMVQYQEERRSGMDIVFAFDVSRSMNVRDIEYDGETISRLEGAKIIATNLLATLRDRHAEYRYAAAVGKGEGVLAIPLTYGVETLQTMIDSLSSSAISAAGTNVEKLTRAAIRAFPPALSARYPAEKSVIVFTDGEALSGLFQEAVDEAKKEQIRVHAVCIGSEKGGPIPIGVSEKGTALFLQNKTGAAIVSRAERGALQEAVENAGGLFIGIDVDDRDSAVSALREALLPESLELLEEEGGAEMRETARMAEKKKDVNFFFVALALVFFALHKGAFYHHRFYGRAGRADRAPKTSVRKKPKPLLSALLLLFLFSSCAPVEAKLRLLEGNFYVTQDMLPEAEASYAQSRSLATSGDVPYALYALALVRLLNEEKEPAKAEDDGAAVALFDQAHALIMTENVADNARKTAAETGDDEGKAVRLSRHGHGERHRELAYRIHYNAGIAHYHAGNAEEAAREFRQALLVDPGRIEAKRNLEISLALLENKSEVETSEEKTARPVREGQSRGNSVLFDFIQQKETGRWKSWAWQGGEGDPSLDY